MDQSPHKTEIPVQKPWFTRFTGVGRWLFADKSSEAATLERDEPIDWVRAIPLVLIHLACLAVIWVGVSWIAVAVAAAMYLVRMFVITAFYHRYFSHRAFKTSRAFGFVMALIGCSAGQRSPLWWSAHHRHHHKNSDEHDDLHSPHLVGLIRSHMGWFLTKSAFATNRRYIRDWYRFRELRWLDRFDWLPFVGLGVAMFGLGVALEAYAPGLGTNGPQMLVWGFFVSTIVLYHCTYTINSLAHRFGKRRFNTSDDSRNNLPLAVLTLGEGWHNNHHHYPASARQGFYWWEIDLTYYGLLVLRRLGLIWDLRPVPEHAMQRNRIVRERHREGSR